MRLFFLFLLLLNLAYFVWQEPVTAWLRAWAEPPPTTVPARQPEAPPLVLLAERDGAAGTPEPVAPAAPPVAPPIAQAAPAKPAEPRRPPARQAQAARCIEIGPYLDETRARDARAAAEQAGMVARVHTTEREMPAGAWVLTPERYTLTEARRVMREMNEQGISDTALVSLDDGVAVSLGIFTRNVALERRKRELAAHGYTPEVRPRTAQRTVHLVILEGGVAEGALKSLINVLAQAEPRLAWREAECPP